MHVCLSVCLSVFVAGLPLSLAMSSSVTHLP